MLLKRHISLTEPLRSAPCFIPYCDSELWPSNQKLDFSISRLQTTQPGPLCDPHDLCINIDASSHGVCEWIDCNNMRLLVVDSGLTRERIQNGIAACLKHVLNPTVILLRKQRIFYFFSWTQATLRLELRHYKQREGIEIQWATMALLWC